MSGVLIFSLLLVGFVLTIAASGAYSLGHHRGTMSGLVRGYRAGERDADYISALVRKHQGAA